MAFRFTAAGAGCPMGAALGMTSEGATRAEGGIRCAAPALHHSALACAFFKNSRIGVLQCAIAARMKSAQARGWAEGESLSVRSKGKEHVVVVDDYGFEQVETRGLAQASLPIGSRMHRRIDIELGGTGRTLERTSAVDHANAEWVPGRWDIGYPDDDAWPRLRAWADSFNFGETAPENIAQLRRRIERRGPFQSSDVPPLVS